MLCHSFSDDPVEAIKEDTDEKLLTQETSVQHFYFGACGTSNPILVDIHRHREKQEERMPHMTL